MVPGDQSGQFEGNADGFGTAWAEKRLVQITRCCRENSCSGGPAGLQGKHRYRI